MPIVCGRFRHRPPAGIDLEAPDGAFGASALGNGGNRPKSRKSGDRLFYTAFDSPVADAAGVLDRIAAWAALSCQFPGARGYLHGLRRHPADPGALLARILHARAVPPDLHAPPSAPAPQPDPKLKE